MYCALQRVKPIEGAGKSGLPGFMKGVGQGLIGVVTKPVVGVFDSGQQCDRRHPQHHHGF